MLSNTGNILVLGSVLFTSLIIYSTFENIKNKNFKISNKLIYFSMFQVTLIFTSFLLLTLAFIFSDFSLLAVYQNSHTSKPIFYDSYKNNRQTGSLIIIDEQTNETIGAGMIIKWSVSY